MKNNKIFISKKTKGQRRNLRNNTTEAESRLWSRLKGRQIFDYKFRRQHGIGNYIVDFYCPTLKLVIEVDGESHLSKKGIEHDIRRDEYLNNLGITVCRFNNQQVYDNLDGVLSEIVRKNRDLNSRIHLKLTSPGPSFKRRGMFLRNYDRNTILILIASVAKSSIHRSEGVVHRLADNQLEAKYRFCKGLHLIKY